MIKLADVLSEIKPRVANGDTHRKNYVKFWELAEEYGLEDTINNDLEHWNTDFEDGGAFDFFFTLSSYVKLDKPITEDTLREYAKKYIDDDDDEEGIEENFQIALNSAKRIGIL